MIDDPFFLVLGGLSVVLLTMMALCLVVSRWKLAQFRFEREVMALAMLAMGPVLWLLADAIPLDPPYMAAKTTYLQLGMVVLCVQTLFWSAFLRLRKDHRAQQAVLRAAA